jgi:hypothetical protein
VFSVRYELGSFIPEDGILHSHRPRRSLVGIVRLRTKSHGVCMSIGGGEIPNRLSGENLCQDIRTNFHDKTRLQRSGSSGSAKFPHMFFPSGTWNDPESFPLSTCPALAEVTCCLPTVLAAELCLPHFCNVPITELRGFDALRTET